MVAALEPRFRVPEFLCSVTTAPAQRRRNDSSAFRQSLLRGGVGVKVQSFYFYLRRLIHDRQPAPGEWMPPSFLAPPAARAPHAFLTPISPAG
jgi:hypothetical protein